MDFKYFLIGMISSYLVGIIVSMINIMTEKALYYRKKRKERNND